MKKLVAGTLLAASLFLVGCSSAPQKKADVIQYTAKEASLTYFKSTARMDLKTATLGFMPEGKVLGGDPSAEGKQFARVEVTITGTAEEPYYFNYTNFSLDTAKEKGVTQTFLINDSNAKDLFSSTSNKKLAKGESVTGAIYYEVDAKETLDTMSLNYKGYDEQGAEKLATIALKK